MRVLYIQWITLFQIKCEFIQFYEYIDKRGPVHMHARTHTHEHYIKTIHNLHSPHTHMHIICTMYTHTHLYRSAYYIHSLLMHTQPYKTCTCTLCAHNEQSCTCTHPYRSTHIHKNKHACTDAHTHLHAHSIVLRPPFSSGRLITASLHSFVFFNLFL